MTLKQFMEWDGTIPFEEWDAECKRRLNVCEKIRKLADKIQEADDALSVLSDEVGSDRWQKWQEQRKKAEKGIAKIKRTEADWLKKAAPHLY